MILFFLPSGVVLFATPYSHGLVFLFFRRSPSAIPLFPWAFCSPLLNRMYNHGAHNRFHGLVLSVVTEFSRSECSFRPRPCAAESRALQDACARASQSEAWQAMAEARMNLPAYCMKVNAMRVLCVSVCVSPWVSLCVCSHVTCQHMSCGCICVCETSKCQTFEHQSYFMCGGVTRTKTS